jgi:phage shock protein E
MKKLGIVAIGILTLLGVGVYLGTTQNSTNKNNLALMIETVDSSTFKNRSTEEERVLIDVRTPGEFSEGHIPGSVNIDFNAPTFVAEIEKLDKNEPYSIYCRSGNRSGQALELMDSLGFADVLDLQGGVISWERNGNTLCTNC